MMKLRVIEKVVSPAVGLATVALAVLAVTAAAQGPAVGAKFTLFGNAQWVTGGVTPPGNKAVELTSDCTPTTPAPAAFSCNLTTFTFSGVAFTPRPGQPLTLADITTLSTAYNVGGSDCGGGSPRFEIAFATGNHIWVYIGPYPNWINCFYGWQNTGNVVTSTDLRWDSSSRGGATYGNYAEALTAAGSTPITQISLVLDAGWQTVRGQDTTIESFTVNNNVLHP